MQRKSVSELKPWDDNPRDITESAFNQLLRQLRFGEVENLVAMKDGTVLSGNMRLKAYQVVGKTEAWVTEVDFVPKGDKFQLLVNEVLAVHQHPAEKKGQPVEFDSIKQGMVALSTLGNSHVGVFNDIQLSELLTAVEIEPDLFQVNMTPGTRIEDLVAAVSPLDREFDQDKMAEKLDVYENGTIKQIVVYFTNDQYIQVMPRLEELMKKTGAKNNTELFLQAIKALENIENSDG